MSDDKIKLGQSDLKIGSKLQWPVYDDMGLLQMNAGALITSENQISSLVERGLYRELTKEEKINNISIVAPSNPFQKIYQLAQQLSTLSLNIENGVDNFDGKIKVMAGEVQELNDNNADAMLGTVHLCYDFRYSIIHSIHTAILCDLVGSRIEMDSHRRITIMAAALTSNISMYTLQDELQVQKIPLTEEQIQLIENHPKRSVELLKNAGVKDVVWLSTVLQHHERLDGSGYPKGLKVNKIAQGPRLIAVADRYTAMVANRAYRVGLHAKDVLKTFFADRGLAFDEKSSLALIKELGIFPPGAFVRLKNKEIAVVIRRNDEIQPIVACILDSRGKLYSEPVVRDCSSRQDFNIQEMINLNKLPKTLNIASLWGF